MQALEDVSLDVFAGEIFGIIGPSGAGKSTLIRCINLLESPQQGRVLIDGADVTEYRGRRLREVRRSIGMVFQHFNLLTNRTAAGNVSFPMEIVGTPKAERMERVKELLSFVGLADKTDRYPSELSGGEKQRVGIARALATQPRILLCDEATSALDPETTVSILTCSQHQPAPRAHGRHGHPSDARRAGDLPSCGGARPGQGCGGRACVRSVFKSSGGGDPPSDPGGGRDCLAHK